jgi:hypothetical protein
MEESWQSAAMSISVPIPIAITPRVSIPISTSVPVPIAIAAIAGAAATCMTIAATAIARTILLVYCVRIASTGARSDRADFWLLIRSHRRALGGIFLLNFCEFLFRQAGVNLDWSLQIAQW